MTRPPFLYGSLIVAAAASLSSGLAQHDSSKTEPLLRPPVAKAVVALGFRDWGPATVAGATVLAGNQTGGGGLFAIDAATGKAKWSFRPVFSSGTASVSTRPAVAGNMVLTPFAAAHPGAVIAVSLATGKEVWRGPDPEQNAWVAVDGDLAYILSKNGNLYALNAATGREHWKTAFATNRAPCASEPIVRDGVVYLTGIGNAAPGDATKPAGYYLFALDAKTGQERWRYRAEAPYVPAGVCLNQPLVTADTIFATGDTRLYAVQRNTGRDRWPSVEVRRPVDGRDRAVKVSALVDAGLIVVGMTSGFLIAFDKDSGRTAWELAGQYRETASSLAVSGKVLYFQGDPGAKAPSPAGKLHALDLQSRQILWSYSRQMAGPDWPFGWVTPVNGGLWVDHYQALLKLE